MSEDRAEYFGPLHGCLHRAAGARWLCALCRELGRAGLSRSGPEVTLCARERSSRGPWSEGPCRPSPSRGLAVVRNRWGCAGVYE